jgi:hypothetical protein
MPSVEKGESEEKYVSRCIPIVIKEGTAKDSAQAAAICHSMYQQHQKKESQADSELKEYTFECQLTELTLEKKPEGTIEIPKDQIENAVNQDDGWVRVHATAVIGDRMMKNAYVPYEELKRTIALWNGTYHDINHMGTSYPDTTYPYKRQNIDYIVGYQDKANADDTTKRISMVVNINKKSPKYQSWQSFADINKQSGRIPNVSMSVMARAKKVKAKDLNFDATSYGFGPEDYVDCLYDIQPKALTTCIQGECNGEKGCGLAMENNQGCNCGDTCETKVTDGVSDEVDVKKLTSMRERIKKLKEEKNNE